MKYKVISASVYGKNGIVHQFGEILEADDFIGNRFEGDRPDQLVKEGFLEVVEEKVESKKENKEKPERNKRGPKRTKKVQTASESLLAAQE